MAADLDLITRELGRLGFDAFTDGSLGPTDIRVNVNHRVAGTVVLAHDFNVSGWEAAWNPPPDAGRDQEPLHAWLSGDADAKQVALWAAGLAYDPTKCLDADMASR